MNLGQDSAHSPVGTLIFDVLRARLESGAASPAVIAITAATLEDGKEVVARGIAYSLAATGYATLLLDTCLIGRSRTRAPHKLTFDETAHQLTPDRTTGRLTVCNLSDLLLQKTTNVRHTQSALQILRGKFDYVIVDTDCGAATAFAASLLVAADAVLVIVKKGRREMVDDTRLAGFVERIGSRFLGAVAVDPSVIKDGPKMNHAPDSIPDWRPNQPAQLENDRKRREIVEWPK